MVLRGREGSFVLVSSWSSAIMLSRRNSLDWKMLFVVCTTDRTALPLYNYPIVVNKAQCLECSFAKTGEITLSKTFHFVFSNEMWTNEQQCSRSTSDNVRSSSRVGLQGSQPIYAGNPKPNRSFLETETKTPRLQ